MKSCRLVLQEFFWDYTDEFAPVGSDEGDMALTELRDWKKENPNRTTYEYLKWTIESVGEMELFSFSEKLLDKELIKSQIEDPEFDDHQYIFRLDMSIIATGFDQMVDERKIDEENSHPPID